MVLFNNKFSLLFSKERVGLFFNCKILAWKVLNKLSILFLYLLGFCLCKASKVDSSTYIPKSAKDSLVSLNRGVLDSLTRFITLELLSASPISTL